MKPQNVLLICSQGASTSMLYKKISDYALSQGEELYVHATSLAAAPDIIEEADVVLIGPQIRYMLNKVKDMAIDKPVEAIAMEAYGMMDGEKVYKQVMMMLEDYH